MGTRSHVKKDGGGMSTVYNSSLRRVMQYSILQYSKC